MLLSDVYVQRGETSVLIAHDEYNLMNVRVFDSPISDMIGLTATIKRPNALPTDAFLPHALFFDGCVKVAQFLELESMGNQDKLEEGIKLTIGGLDVLQLFPMYYKDKNAWGADGHVYMTKNGEMETFTLPVPSGNTWQNTVASVMVSPVLKMTLSDMVTYDDFMKYYEKEKAEIDINNVFIPSGSLDMKAFEKRADAFAQLLRRAKEWRPN